MQGTRCRGCGEVRTGALLACAACGSDDVTPAEIVGEGTVLGSTRVHSGSTRPTPFDVVLVETDDGLRVVGFADGRLPVGAPVRVEREENGVPWYEAS